MLKKDTVVAFRTSELVNQLCEIVAKRFGQSKSEYLAYNAIDTAMDFEKVRHMDTLADFLDIACRYLTQDMEEEAAEKLKQKLTKLQQNYKTQRLPARTKYQKHLTNIAIKNVLQDYSEDFAGMDGFIIQQCVKSIYDNLLFYGLISAEEWQAKTANYELYMDLEGAEIIKGE